VTGYFDGLEQQLRGAAEARAQAVARPARWWRRRRNLAILGVLALGVATPAVSRVTGVWHPDVAQPPPLGVATVSATPPGSTSGSCATAPQTQTPAQARARARIDPQVLAQLAVLRRPQRPTDLPAHGPLLESHPFGQTLVSRTVRYVGSVAQQRYYLAVVVGPQPRAGCSLRHAPRKAQLCVMIQGASGGCGIGPIGLRRYGIDGSSGRGRQARSSVVYEIVPDAVTAVTIRYGPSTRSFAVHDNFYGYVVALPPTRRPDAVTWTLRDGRRYRVPGYEQPAPPPASAHEIVPPHRGSG
jgi:hypothetical protein